MQVHVKTYGMDITQIEATLRVGIKVNRDATIWPRVATGIQFTVHFGSIAIEG
ncbi:Uncharacterised protein [Vibrio cholerae]|nr:Uncharacterised protein [Vibrio cholerae]